MRTVLTIDKSLPIVLTPSRCNNAYQFLFPMIEGL